MIKYTKYEKCKSAENGENGENRHFCENGENMVQVKKPIFGKNR